MGAIFSLNLCHARRAAFIRWKEHSGFALVGTSDAAAQDYQGIAYHPPLILLMGSERQGLPQDLLAVCDHVVSLPMVGRSDSLNLGVATGIMLYELFNQQRRHA